MVSPFHPFPANPIGQRHQNGVVLVLRPSPEPVSKTRVGVLGRRGSFLPWLSVRRFSWLDCDIKPFIYLASNITGYLQISKAVPPDPWNTHVKDMTHKQES